VLRQSKRVLNQLACANSNLRETGESDSVSLIFQ
jgi:hypothetical protein